jgi:ComF family protein
MIKKITAILFPIKCAVCGRLMPADDKYRLCSSCFDKIRPVGRFQCKGCGRVLPDVDKFCFDCLKKRPVLLIRSYAQFNDSIRPLIHKFKYGHQPYLARILAKFMLIAFHSSECFSGIDMIVPVPCHWSRRLGRGYDHVQLLAREFSAASGIAYNDKLLVKNRRTPPQARLSRERRLKNLADAFSIKDELQVRGKSVLLIDDVCTTGATLSACAKTLLSAGAYSVTGLCTARD